MKLLWTLLKVALVIALLIPVSIIVLSTVLGLFGALLGLAILALRIAVVGLVGWGAYRLFKSLFGSPAPRPVRPEVRELARVDPHYEAALRELDQELGTSR